MRRAETRAVLKQCLAGRYGGFIFYFKGLSRGRGVVFKVSRQVM